MSWEIKFNFGNFLNDSAEELIVLQSKIQLN